jgi:hypothetical protein
MATDKNITSEIIRNEICRIGTCSSASLSKACPEYRRPTVTMEITEHIKQLFQKTQVHTFSPCSSLKERKV